MDTATQSSDAPTWVTAMLEPADEDELGSPTAQAATPATTTMADDQVQLSQEGDPLKASSVRARPSLPTRHSSFGDSLHARHVSDRSISPNASTSFISSGEESFVDPLLFMNFSNEKRTSRATRLASPVNSKENVIPISRKGSEEVLGRSKAACIDVLGRRLPDRPPSGPVDMITEPRHRKTSAFSFSKSAFRNDKSSTTSNSRHLDHSELPTPLDLTSHATNRPVSPDVPLAITHSATSSISSDSTTSEQLSVIVQHSSRTGSDTVTAGHSTPRSADFPSLDSRRRPPPQLDPPANSIPPLPVFTSAFREPSIHFTGQPVPLPILQEPFPAILPPRSPGFSSTSFEASGSDACRTPRTTINSDKDGLVIKRLASRAHLLEAKLSNEARSGDIDSPTTAAAGSAGPTSPHDIVSSLPRPPHSRTVSESSRWWRPRTGKSKSTSSVSWRRSWSVQADGWSVLHETSGTSAPPMSSAEAKSMREKRRALEARRKTQDWLASTSVRGGSSQSSWAYWKNRSRNMSRKSWILVGVIIVALALAIALAATLIRRSGQDQVTTRRGCSCVNRGKPQLQADSSCLCSCPSDWGGTSCHRNATCAGAGDYRIAQGILDVAMHSHSLFQPSLNLSRIPIVVNTYFGRAVSNSSTSCSSQLDLLTLPRIDSVNFPLRLAWTEAAIIWANMYSESLTGIRSFVSALDFNSFGDEPVTVSVSRYQVLVAGYVFDFSTMTRTPPQVFWSLRTRPSAEQESLVSVSIKNVLDRVSTLAVAGSNGRMKALEHFWTEHGLELDQLEAFRNAVAEAPLVVAVGQMGRNRGGPKTGRTKPRACDPDLDDVDREAVIAFENKVFGLPLDSKIATNDCENRPTYVSLDILRLSRTKSNELVILDPVIKTRCTFFNPRLSLSDNDPVSISSPAGMVSTLFRDGEVEMTDVGITGWMDHVLLNLLIGLANRSDSNLLTKLVRHVTSDQQEKQQWRGDFLFAIQAQVWGPL
ncbi:hypothetical protein ACM66B_003074 [Microbotryomycetes sp. NB124-2]